MTAPTHQPTISVIVPCRGHAMEVAQCLRALRQQDLAAQYEVILVDSVADPAVASIAGEYPEVRLVRSKVPLTAGAARNLGVRHARADYLAFTDADCIPERTWLAVAMAALVQDRVAVGGSVTNCMPFHPVATMDNILQFADQQPGRPDGPAKYFPGCNVAFRKAEFMALGGFPEEIQPGQDAVLTKAAAARWAERVRHVPGMCVRHKGQTSLSGYWRHQRTFGLSRGKHGLFVTPSQLRLCRHLFWSAAAGAKRLIHITLRTAQWHPRTLPRLFLYMPLLIFGLTAWTIGFRQGCRINGSIELDCGDTERAGIAGSPGQ